MNSMSRVAGLWNYLKDNIRSVLQEIFKVNDMQWLGVTFLIIEGIFVLWVIYRASKDKKK